MQRPAYGVGVVLAFVFALCCGAPAARAQAAEPAPPAQYHALIEQALVESSASRWPEALALFRQAHAVYPNARTHRGIGMVAYEVRDYVEAQRHLTLALRSPRRPLDAAQRAEVSALLERTRAFVGRYELGALPPGATLSVDGKPSEREADGTLVLGLGHHRVQANAAGPERSGSVELQVKGGEHAPLPLVLEAVAPAPAPAALPTEPDAAPAALSPATEPGPADATVARDTDAARGSNSVPIVLTAAGGVMLVAGAVLLVVGLADVATVEEAKPGTLWSELEAANARAPILTGVGIGLLGVGGALAIGGGVLWLSSDDAEPHPDAELGGMSFRVRACF